MNGSHRPAVVLTVLCAVSVLSGCSSSSSPTATTLGNDPHSISVREVACLDAKGFAATLVGSNQVQFSTSDDAEQAKYDIAFNECAAQAQVGVPTTSANSLLAAQYADLVATADCFRQANLPIPSIPSPDDFIAGGGKVGGNFDVSDPAVLSALRKVCPEKFNG